MNTATAALNAKLDEIELLDDSWYGARSIAPPAETTTLLREALPRLVEAAGDTHLALAPSTDGSLVFEFDREGWAHTAAIHTDGSLFLCTSPIEVPDGACDVTVEIELPSFDADALVTFIAKGVHDALSEATP